ncbi:cysteine--tRNA ligase [Flammeovirga kamogawensis]|uniref:Cysteine--tRNA ligase n=1 Tax=Flammeovirga kamogawensis TaxID=373891 RepID=A0ABX8H0Y8_9BACT|nr:cysteine--tRNA ligase [Flammeovirga kamogawensis]MBB6459506.1 cysteinyl-tRNA synthetase [Flammeovirga kamogawensis]QWG09057.1 cysteine--tRNA ligase [Flammeovirga kamogawensis]TRX67346.1 cysteine--tRNA ligase [Flammeovirga kamogawensis]
MQLDLRKQLKVYNTLSGKKELFEPINPPFVGMYVCGPTVYGDAHLGHSRPAITFDVIFRYLKHQDFKVRYVRNITDVGHLVGDADEGEDKIAKKAKLEQIEPMEVVQFYTDRYHKDMAALNVLPPSIEPRATGHIIEQIEMIEKIIEAGYGYESNGSVYFDVVKYNEDKPYGILSGRKLEDMLEGTRDLDGGSDKKNHVDFALWKKAEPQHIMRWNSPWSVGFPGWHLECSAMSAKYLGNQFDIHGGGMDLKFPHHEAEIAQSEACNHVAPAKYWLHNNLITINGQKMGKSLGNFITLEELFAGNHELLEEAYSPMTIRFFVLQAQYRSTIDFSNEALQAARKGYRKVMNGLRLAKSMQYDADENVAVNQKQEKNIESIINSIYRGMNDDFNTAVAMAGIFNLLKKINAVHTGNIPAAQLGEKAFNDMLSTYITFIEDVLGLKEETPDQFFTALDYILKDYSVAKDTRDYDKVDAIRAQLKEMGVVVKDTKSGIEWAYDEV